MNIEVLPFDVLTASRDEWTRFHEFRRKRWSEHSPGDPVTADETVETMMKASERDFEDHRFVVTEAGNTETQIGFLSCGFFRENSPSYKGNEKVCFTLIAVLTPYRRKGIGIKLLAKTCELAKKSDKSLIIGGTAEADGKAFLRMLGAQEALDSVENRLLLNQVVNWGMVEQWVQEGPERSPNSKIEFFTSVPDEIIDPYCKIYTETMNQQPLGDLQVGDFIITPEERRKQEADFKKIKAQWLTLITRETNGDISGLTEVLYDPHRPTRIIQMLTGVQEKYRGSGKGKWLKALMLLRIRKEFPQVDIVTTGNATTNAPMLAINHRLGFKKHKESITGQITVEKVEAFLAKNSDYTS